MIAATTSFNLWPAWKTVEQMVWTTIALLPNLVAGLLLFGLFLLLARGARSLIGHLMRKRAHHRHLTVVIGRIAQTACITLGLLLALVVILPNFHPAQLVQLLGVGGVAIGFAFRDIMQNFLAGLLILVTEPFRRPDPGRQLRGIGGGHHDAGYDHPHV
jgi:small-conductance mechanosensitive channel